MNNSTHRRRRLAAAATTFAIAALSLVGCSGGGSDDGGDGDTLKVWWYETDTGPLGQGWNKAIEIFEDEHPGVKVDFELKTYQQMQQSGQLFIDSNDAPDVLEYPKGNATAGLVSSLGLLTDMTEIATDRGWDLDNTAQDVGLYKDGIMGSGARYGVTNYSEFVGAWYNADLFKKYDLEVPTTLDEFEDVLQTFVDHGITPLAMGASDYVGVHLLYELALSYMDEKSWEAYQQFTGEPDWDAWQKAAKTIADWTNKGYISKDSTGVDAQDAANAFFAGEYPLMVSGSWWVDGAEDLVKAGTIGEFLFPGNTLHPGSGGNMWVVPEKAQNKDLAYDFIGITLRPEVQNLIAETGGLPIASDADASVSAAGALELGLWAELANAKEGGLAWYPDWPVAGLFDVQVAQVADLIQGKVEPKQAVENLKTAYDQGKEDAGL